MNGRWSNDRPDMPQRMRLLAGRMALRTRSPRAVMVVVGLIAIVLVSAIAMSMMRTNSPGQAATAGQPLPPTMAAPAEDDAPASTAPSVSPSSSPSPSPSKSSKPGGRGEAPHTPGDAEGDDGDAGDAGDAGDSPEPKKTKPPATTTPSRPEAFGAWWASEGKYSAKWERPSDDGGLSITGYVVKKCDGTTLKTVGSGTFRVDISHPSLTCVTVQAINSKGAGQTAYFDGIK